MSLGHHLERRIIGFDMLGVIPVRSHLDFLRKNEVLNGGSVLQNLLPRPTTVLFDLTEVLGPKQDSARASAHAQNTKEKTHFKQFSVIFC